MSQRPQTVKPIETEQRSINRFVPVYRERGNHQLILVGHARSPRQALELRGSLGARSVEWCPVRLVVNGASSFVTDAWCVR